MVTELDRTQDHRLVTPLKTAALQPDIGEVVFLLPAEKYHSADRGDQNALNVNEYAQSLQIGRQSLPDRMKNLGGAFQINGVGAKPQHRFLVETTCSGEPGQRVDDPLVRGPVESANPYECAFSSEKVGTQGRGVYRDLQNVPVLNGKHIHPGKDERPY